MRKVQLERGRGVSVVVQALEEDLKVVSGEIIRKNHNVRDSRKLTARGLSSTLTKHLRRRCLKEAGIGFFPEAGGRGPHLIIKRRV